MQLNISELGQDGGKPTILIVDDAKGNVDVLTDILEGCTIRVALNGLRALKIAQSENPPDLILLDVLMPDMDGYEVCRQLQADEQSRKIPVLFVTSRANEDDEAKGFELGAVDYLTKPIIPSIVLARIKTQLILARYTHRMEGLSTKLGRYLSPQIYRSIFEGRTDARVGSARKKLSIFFSDIVGFTKQTDGMEPEDLAYILNGYLDRMSEIVIKHGGIFDKFMGDAVLVFFGDPDTLGVKEDAIACVKMALEMRDAVEPLGEEWMTRGISKGFKVRMGITTGFCTVGNFGSDTRMAYTIIGNQVNLASRLQSTAAPGEVVIVHDTYVLVKDIFQCKPREPIFVKGFEHPIQTYTVIGTSNADQENEIDPEGFILSLKPEEIREIDKAKVIKKLKKALVELKEEPVEPTAPPAPPSQPPKEEATTPAQQLERLLHFPEIG